MHEDACNTCFNLGINTAVIIMRTYAIELLNRMSKLDVQSNEYRELWTAHEELNACADAVSQQVHREG